MSKPVNSPRANRLAELLTAASDGEGEQVRKLLAKEIQLDRIPSGWDRDAITAAATNGHEEIVRLLLNSGAQVTGKKRGNFPLDACFDSWFQNRDDRSKFAPTLKLLLRHGAEPTPGMITKVIMYEADLDLLRILLDAGKAWPWYTVFLAEGGGLWAAASMGDVTLDILELLLQAGSQPNHSSPINGTPLSVAVKLNREKSVKKLILHGANPDFPAFTGETPLLLAARSGLVNMVKLLIDAGAEVNRPGDIKLSDELLETRPSPGETNYNPFPIMRQITPLIVAARLGHSEVVRELLKANADPSLAGSDGRMAIDWAREEGHDEVIKVLVET